MLDGFKITVPVHEGEETYIPKSLERGVPWEHYCDQISGEIKPHHVKYRHLYAELKLSRVYPFRLEIRGSLPEFFKDETYSVLTHSEENKAIDEIAYLFCFDPQDAELHRLEVTEDFEDLPGGALSITNNLLLHKTDRFEKLKKGTWETGHNKNSPHKTVKIYDKGQQLRETEDSEFDRDLLRFERRYQRSAPLKAKGIHFFADLKDSACKGKLMDVLIETWENVLIWEEPLEGAPSGIAETFREFRFAGKWLEEKDRSKSSYYRLRKRYKEEYLPHTRNVHARIHAELLDRKKEFFEQERESSNTDPEYWGLKRIANKDNIAIRFRPSQKRRPEIPRGRPKGLPFQSERIFSESARGPPCKTNNPRRTERSKNPKRPTPKNEKECPDERQG